MKTKHLFLLTAILFALPGCENQQKKPSEPAVDVSKKIDMSSVLSDEDAQKHGEQLTLILKESESDPKYSGLKTNEERFMYFLDLVNRNGRIEGNINYNDIKNISNDLSVINRSLSESSARMSAVATVPKATYKNYLHFFSASEGDYINYAIWQLNSTSDLSSFNTKMIALRREIRNQEAPYIDYINDRVRMLENFLSLCSNNVNQWGDDLDTFNPYNTTPNPFGSYDAANVRATGSCRGFLKKLCIAAITAAMAAAAGSISYGGATLVGAAAGYIIARCCICCKCNIVCDNSI